MTFSTTNDTSNNAGGGGAGGGMGAMLTNGALVNKRVTVLAINVKGFHGTVNTYSPSSVAGPTAALTELISATCNRYRGMIDAFHGDHFVLSFNAARMNAEGPVKAALCALELSRCAVTAAPSPSGEPLLVPIAANANIGGGGGANQHDSLHAPSSSSQRQLFAMGLCTGKAAVGHLGSATLKRLSIIGPVYSRALALERLCGRVGGAKGGGGALMNVDAYYAGVMGSRSGHHQQQQKKFLHGKGAVGRSDVDTDEGSDANDDSAAVIGTDAAEEEEDGDDAELLASVIQCLTDGPLANEISHSFTLQAMGALAGGPFKRTDRSAAHHGTTGKARRHHKRGAKGTPAATGGGGGGEGDGAVPPLRPPPLELFYALRRHSASTREDEWLYEVQQSSSNPIAEVNGVVISYLHEANAAHHEEVMRMLMAQRRALDASDPAVADKLKADAGAFSTVNSLSGATASGSSVPSCSSPVAIANLRAGLAMLRTRYCSVGNGIANANATPVQAFGDSTNGAAQPSLYDADPYFRAAMDHASALAPPPPAEAPPPLTTTSAINACINIDNSRGFGRRPMLCANAGFIEGY